MRVLIIGGTGLISVGIVKHLLARGADVTMFNRGQRDDDGRVDRSRVRTILGDREDPASFESRFATEKPFDVVVDMICYTPAHAAASIRAFAGRCRQFIFCSTVCTYGVKIPPGVVVD